MLYINKDSIPIKIQEQILQIEKTEEWKKIEEDDIKGIRACFDSLDKGKIREELVKEQHGLCAYCMRRITADTSTIIEHYKPIRNKIDALNYKNLLGCCDGGRYSSDRNKVLCCDAAKRDKELTIGPFNKEFVESLRYSKEGYIYTYPVNEKAESEINDILKLNGERDDKGHLKYDTGTQLVATRKSTYKSYAAVMKRIEKRYSGNRNRIASEIRRMISMLESQNEYLEFAGMILYLLKKRLKSN